MKSIDDDILVMLRSSEAFCNASRKQRLELEVQWGDEAFEELMGPLVVTAVNMAFALELLLKALLRTYGKPAHGHGLSELFNGLDQPARKDIEARYQSLRQANPDGPIYALGVPSTDGTTTGDGWPEPRAESIREILGRASDTLVHWRYAHEQGAAPNILKMEAHDLDLAYDAITRHLLKQYEFG